MCGARKMIKVFRLLLLVLLILSTVVYAVPPVTICQLDSSDVGLVLLAHCNENSGTSLRDESPYGNTGTLAQSDHWVVGKFGYAYDYDGTDDKADFGAPASLNNVGSGDYTVSIWFKTTSVLNEWNGLIGTCSADANGWWRLQYNPSTDGLTYWDDDGTLLVGVPTSFNLNDGVWHNIVMVQDFGTNHELFVDGSSLGTFADNGDSSPGGKSLIVGYQGDLGAASYLVGIVDEIGIYDGIAWTIEQIQDYYRRNPRCVAQ